MENLMEKIPEYVPFLIPFVILQFGLTVISLIHVLRHKTYRFGNRVLWAIVSFVSIIGPVVYFAVGKGDE